jgi:hypothetical protein
MIDIQADQYAAGKSNGQTKNIDERKYFVLYKVSPRDFEIILYHNNFI